MGVSEPCVLLLLEGTAFELFRVQGVGSKVYSAERTSLERDTLVDSKGHLGFRV